MSKLISLDQAAAVVTDGSRIAFGGGGALMRRPMAFARALARRDARGLHAHHFLGGLELEVLIAAGAVATTNCAYVGLLEHGQAPSFQRAARAGALDVCEYSEFSMMASLRAADLGIPFIPWKTPYGSSMVDKLGLRTVRDPYGSTELLALPAIDLDFAVLHAERADEDGYVEAPVAPDLVWDYDALIGRVARTTIVCVEEIGPPRDPACVALVGREVAHVVHTPGGAWPTGLYPRYRPDLAHVVEVYLAAAEEGGAALERYLETYVNAAEDSERIAKVAHAG